MKARQGYAKQEMVGQKIIESASSTSVLFIIRKKYVKLIIYAQGTFSHCAFLKRHFLSNIFSLVLMKARHGKARQKMSGQKIIEASLFTSVVFIIRKQYVKLIIYAQGTFCLCTFLKRQFPEQHFFPKILMTVRQGKSGQNNIEASLSTSVLLISRKQYEKLIIYAKGTLLYGSMRIP
jgi:hypothetical protein